MASCSTGAPRNGSDDSATPKSKIQLSDVVVVRQLSTNTPETIELGGNTRVIVTANAAKSGTKLSVREVLNVDQQVGGVTVADKVWDVAVSGKLLSTIKVVYHVPTPPAGAPEPMAGVLDRTTGTWARVEGAVYDANNQALEVPLMKSAAVGPLQWDWSKAIAGAAAAAGDLVAQAEGNDPQCTSEDDVNSRYNVVVSTVASVAWCAGVDQGQDVLRVRNRGRLPVAIVASGFSSLPLPSSGPYGYVDQLATQLGGNHVWQLPTDRQVRVIAPGSELTLSFAKTSTTAEVYAEVDGYSQHVAALAVAAEVATAIFAGQGTAAHTMLASDSPVRTSLFRKLTSAQCSDELGVIDQNSRHSADELATFVGRVVTTCIGGDTLQELAQSVATTTTTTAGGHDSFAPSDPSQLPTDLAGQIAGHVAATVSDLTQRSGQPQLSKVVMEPRPPSTSPGTSAPARTTTSGAATVDTTVATTGPATTDTATTVATTPAPTTTTPSDTSLPATTIPTTTTPPTTTSTDPTTTTTVDPGPGTTVLSSFGNSSREQPVCVGSGSVTQSFLVPTNVHELDSITIGTSGTFTADLEVLDGDQLMTSVNLRATGSDATAVVARPLRVAGGQQLAIRVSNVRKTAGATVPIRFTLGDALAGTAQLTNSCADASGSNVTQADLAMAISGH